MSEGLAALAAMDRRLGAVIERAGPVPLRRREPGYQGLAEIIVAQMVSKASASAIWQRLQDEAGGGCTPEAIATLSDAQCRRIGLSRSKEATLKAAAAAVLEGVVDPQALCTMPADRSITVMTGIKGIGPWTAEVYLLFCAGHPDIFPAGDVALQSAAAHAFELDERPDQKTLREMAGDWQPWRGVAARLLWAYYATEMRRGDVSPTGD
ncbi:DNA-3-methyladenine glycosylase family protein [Hoeflea prorocentri]|uniref:DNA-3-methyladenine glycosylase II n=1 Tax=Hoeflea prorocentri TaxID=1922333 RepID=A0A9X3ULX6_9HYPH|nr:DNA-3-methyladenine glycosylase 2 family protein [Hoeflea prorocentri]MCY6383657.1 DNA-3-methyladenine glycosylase 2 family protein [Hoeflea prorocentri]MDA5401457.1 DNA-3-methyladenine glycosylase 2 family protein [Hoeflea prorocentri]